MTDPLLEALSQPTKRTGGHRCGVELARMALTDEQRNAVDAVIDEIRQHRLHGTPTRHTASGLARLLNEHGIPVNDKTMQAHIARRCRCD